MDSNFLPVEIKTAPSKKEISQAVNSLAENTAHSPIEKYVWVKGLEHYVKEAVKILQPKAIESFLHITEGSVKEDILGVEVTITKERITRKLEKYTYTDKVSAIEKKIEAKKNELKLLEEKLKLQQILEVNHGEAKLDVWEEDGGEQVGIRCSLRK